jgi:hypothetical protein
MAVELPSPRLGRRWRAHHGEVIQPLAVLIEVIVVELAEGVIEAHDVAGELQALGAECRAQQRKPRFTLGTAHVLKADALADVEALIHPLAPLIGVHRKDGGTALNFSQARQERVRRGANGLGGNARRADGVELRLDLPLRCDALEWPGETFLLR